MREYHIACDDRADRRHLLPSWLRADAVGCTYSIFLQIDRIWYAAEYVHPTG